MRSEGLFSSVLHKNVCCEFSLELPRRGDSNGQGDSNEYPQHTFLWRNKQNYPLMIMKYLHYLFYCLYVCSYFSVTHTCCFFLS